MPYLTHLKSLRCKMKIEKIALEKIKKRKKQNQEIASANLQKALEDEIFKNLYYEKKSLIIEVAKCEADNLPSNRYKLNDLEHKLLDRLEQLGLPKDGLEIKYFCQKCKDTGYVNGKICSCLKREISKTLFEKSGLKKKLHCFDDSNFEIFDNSELMKKTYQKMEKWCDEFETSYLKNIGLFGGAGSGKTFLMECIADKLIKKGKYVYFTTAFKMILNLLEYHTTFDNTKNELLQQYLDCDVLIIDDMGTEPIYNNVNENYLYLIFNQRIMENKPIIYNTNFTLDEFYERYGERIFSRLINKRNSKVFNFLNSDLRIKNNI